MKLNQRVEYQVGPGVSGSGVVIAVDAAAERVVVCDEDDGSIWEGLMDHAQSCEILPNPRTGMSVGLVVPTLLSGDFKKT